MIRADYMVVDYDSSAHLSGPPEAMLVEESLQAQPAGTVNAYRDSNGIWQYVNKNNVDFMRRIRGQIVRSVYVIPRLSV